MVGFKHCLWSPVTGLVCRVIVPGDLGRETSPHSETFPLLLRLLPCFCSVVSFWTLDGILLLGEIVFLFYLCFRFGFGTKQHFVVFRRVDMPLHP